LQSKDFREKEGGHGWTPIEQDRNKQFRFCFDDLVNNRGGVQVGRRRSLGKTSSAERLIGSIRRECIDHVVVFGERHLRHVLLSYKDYYNATRTHLSLNKDAPVPRGVEWAGNIVCRPILGGLHHQYGRM
jgi:hypothetical protein